MGVILTMEKLFLEKLFQLNIGKRKHWLETTGAFFIINKKEKEGKQ